MSTCEWKLVLLTVGREEERENEKGVHDEIVGGKGGVSEINIDICKCI